MTTKIRCIDILQFDFAKIPTFYYSQSVFRVSTAGLESQSKIYVCANFANELTSLIVGRVLYCDFNITVYVKNDDTIQFPLHLHPCTHTVSFESFDGGTYIIFITSGYEIIKYRFT